jgi:hypothetical protein
MPNALSAQYTASILGGDKLSVGFGRDCPPGTGFQTKCEMQMVCGATLSLAYFRLGLNNAGMRRRMR